MDVLSDLLTISEKTHCNPDVMISRTQQGGVTVCWFIDTSTDRNICRQTY